MNPHAEYLLEEYGFDEITNAQCLLSMDTQEEDFTCFS